MNRRPAAPLQAHLPAPSATQLSLYHGALDFDRELRHAMTAAVKISPDSRALIAARMSDLTATRVTEAMIDAWTAPSRDRWNLPARLAPAFDIATGGTFVLQLLARKENHAVLSADDAVLAELGRIQQMESELRSRRHELLGRLSFEDHVR